MSKTFNIDGRLLIAAKGYWFTSGGEKTSFGWQPHLINPQDQTPMYPDTQVRNNLRMAANWLRTLDGDIGAKLLDTCFGKEGNVRSAKFQVTDMTLTEESRRAWSPKRFKIMARIQVDNDTRSVRKNMLAYNQYAWLEGLILEVGLHLTGFDNLDALNKATRLVEEAAQLSTGFGAFRSRGCGQGEVTVEWEKNFSSELIINNDDSPSEHYICKLTALNNFRNKPLEKKNAQILGCPPEISPEQFRGWLMLAYRNAFDRWPTPAEAASISITTFRPSGKEGEVLFPPAMSTLQDEEGAIRDYLDKDRKTLEMLKKDDQEAPSSKTKPLAATCFVSDSTRPEVYSVPVIRRARNAMKDDSFVTKDNGLFIQEHIPAGTAFAGYIRFRKPDAEFCKQILGILESIRPVIKGGVFSCESRVVNPSRCNDGPKLLTEAIPFYSKLATSMAGLSQLTMTTVRRYNTMQNRPRRNTISVAPGSILESDVAQDLDPLALTAWKGFGRHCVAAAKTSTPNRHTTIQDTQAVQSSLRLPKDLTRSQAGNLRNLLNPQLSENRVRTMLEKRLQKHGRKGKASSHEPPKAEMYQALLSLLAEKGVENMRFSLGIALKQHAVATWNKKNQKAGEVAL